MASASVSSFTPLYAALKSEGIILGDSMQKY